MRIHIRRVEHGWRVATIVPRRAARLPPIQVQGYTKESFRAELAKVVEDLSRLAAGTEAQPG